MFHEFCCGILAGMLFTSGLLSDNPNAPAEFTSAALPDPLDVLEPVDWDRIQTDAADFLSGIGVLDTIRAWDDFRRAGELFHYARNGHGIGFDDAAIQDWARSFGERELDSCRGPTGKFLIY
jgi:hypothetical protein